MGLPALASRLALTALILTPIAACSSPAVTRTPTAAPTSASPTPTGIIPTPPPLPGLLPVTPGPIPTAIPARYGHEAQNPNPYFDMGLLVRITPSGFEPAQLIVPCCTPVVFQNATDKPNTVYFVVSKLRSTAIAPGDSWLFTPKLPVSLAYRSATYPVMHGVLSVTPTSEP